MPRLPLILLLLAAVVIVSGCTGGPISGSGGGAGVVIEAFEPDFPQIFTGETAELRVKIRNSGGADSVGGDVDILGVDDSSVDISPIEQCGFKNLIAADPTKGTTGEIQTCSFKFEPLSTAKIPVGLTIQYTPIARLSYGYSTSMVKSITFLSSAEMRQLQDTGRPLPAETITSTSGPVAISINTKGPIRVFENDVTFPLEITVSNVGGGVVCKSINDCNKPEMWNKLTLNYNFGKSSGAGTQSVGKDCPKEIQLFRGQSNTITCKIQANIGDTGNIQKLYQVTAAYGYFTEKSTSITVTGREGGGQ